MGVIGDAPCEALSSPKDETKLRGEASPKSARRCAREPSLIGAGCRTRKALTDRSEVRGLGAARPHNHDEHAIRSDRRRV